MITASNAEIRRVGPSARSESGPDPQEDPGDRDGSQRDRQRHGVEVAVVDPHEAGGGVVVRCRPERPAQLRPREDQPQAAEDDDRDDERQEREDADRDLVA